MDSQNTLLGIKKKFYFYISTGLIIISFAYFISTIFIKEERPQDYNPKNLNLTPKSPIFIKDHIIVKFKDVIRNDKNVEYPITEDIKIAELKKSNYSKFFIGMAEEGAILAERTVKNTNPQRRTYRYYTIKFDRELDLNYIINKCKTYSTDIDSCAKDEIPQNHQVTTNDPFLSRQWHLDASGINAVGAWSITKGDKNIKIGFIDSTGFENTHEDLASNIASADSGQPGAHGTGTMGSAGEVSDNAKGSAGPAQISMYGYDPRQGGGQRGDPGQGGLAGAINRAIEDKVNIITMSFGLHSSARGSAIDDAAKDAFDAGILLLASAGNCVNQNGGDPCDMDESPQDLDTVITVAAMASTNILASWSSHGPKMKTGFAAPGVNVFTTYGEGQRNAYGMFGGTSAASPISAGVAGLIWSANPSLKNQDVLKIMQCSAVCPNGQTCPNENWGYGRLDAGKAVSIANDMKNGKPLDCSTNTPIDPGTPSPEDPTPTPPTPNPPTPRPTPTPNPPTTPGGEVPTPSNSNPLPNLPKKSGTKPKPGPRPEESNQPVKECDPDISNMFCFF